MTRGKDKQYVTFKRWPDVLGRRTPVWDCRNVHHGAQLGVIRWYGAWRQFVFEPVAGTVFSVGCLAAIGEFVEGATEAYRRLKGDRHGAPVSADQ